MLKYRPDQINFIACHCLNLTYMGDKRDWHMRELVIISAGTELQTDHIASYCATYPFNLTK